MPLYFCFTPHGAISGPVKSGLAKEITRLHIEATGTPAAFIHVVFQDLAVGSHFLAGKCDHRTSIIVANFRTGRSEEVRPKLMKSISAAWSRLTSQPERHVVVTLNEADGATVAGLVAQVGEEAAC
jgi:phenylpyruvate tautomerase PptA (4-oxalocrotonate tautomerase family)